MEPNTVQIPKLNLDEGAKAIYHGDHWEGQPFLLVDEGAIVLAGSLQNGIAIDSQFGTTMQGPISLSESPEKISVCGGYWRINPTVLASVGSSAATPVPWLVPAEPELLSGCRDITSILGGIS